MNSKLIIFCLLISIIVIGCDLKINSLYDSIDHTKNRNKKVKMVAPDIAIFDLMKNFVKVKSGKFTMGSNLQNNTKPVHSVFLKTFYISKYEITVEAYAYFLNQTGYKYNYDVNEPSSIRYIDGKYYIKETEKKYPIVNVSWKDANNFCIWLSKISGESITLPTEAQWEKAARGGNHSEGYLYSGSNNADKVAWYSKFVEGSINPVGQKEPNEIGLYDMSGNVWEWCKDWYMKDYYGISPKMDPTGPTWGTSHVYRGGSWYLKAEYLQPAIRRYLGPDDKFLDLGFRVVKNINIDGNKKYTSISSTPKRCKQKRLSMACASAACGMLMRYWSNQFLDGIRLFSNRSCQYSNIFKNKFGTYNGSADNWEEILSALVDIGIEKKKLDVKNKIFLKAEAIQLHGGGYLKLRSHINAKDDTDKLRNTVSPWDRPGVLSYITKISHKNNKTIIESHAVLAYGYRIETTESGYTLWFKVIDGKFRGRGSMAFHFTNDHEYADSDPSTRFLKNTKNRFIVMWPEIKQFKN